MTAFATGRVVPAIDAPALRWLGAEFRKLLPVEPLTDEFKRLCEALEAEEAKAE